MPDKRHVELGLKLRETKLHNGILFNSEAWSSIQDKDIVRLEQVDVAALKALVAGHSKCPTAFYYLEFGALMLRHKVMIRRLMYHHHLLTRDDDELIKKIYQKQRENPIKGDWFLMIKNDVEFIGVTIIDVLLKNCNTLASDEAIIVSKASYEEEKLVYSGVWDYL